MAPVGKSTSVTLLYVDRPILNFARYVDNLEQALRQTEHERFDLRWDSEDFATFDLDGSRVVLGYSDLDTPQRVAGQAPTGYKAALVLAVGPSSTPEASRQVADNGRALCDSVIERIQKRHGADLILWTEVDGVFTMEHFDSLVNTALTMRPAEALPAVLSRFDEPQVGRLMDRLEEEIHPQHPDHDANRKGLRARLPSSLLTQFHPDLLLHDDEAAAAEAGNSADTAEASANDQPHPMHIEMARIRDALYPPEPEGPARAKEPLVRRLTLYTFNTTLLMVSLPVGAALLTYNVLGREDSKVTARVFALTGIGMAFGKSFLRGVLLHHGA